MPRRVRLCACALDSSRQFELPEHRRKLLLPVLRGVARAVQTVSQQSAHVLIARLVILWGQLVEHSPSRWRVEVRPRLSFSVYPWQFLTARLAASPAAASRRAILALRVSCAPSRPTSRARWASQVVLSVGARPTCLFFRAYRRKRRGSFHHQCWCVCDTGVNPKGTS